MFGCERFRPARWSARLILSALGSALWIAAPQSAEAQSNDRPLSFVNDINPILTKAGCNIGVCHAKAGGGQNGFQLSLLGFEPLEDFEHLTQDDRGRRLFLPAPEKSLILRKGTGQVPHGGGVRLTTSSESYARLVEWIRQGTPYDAPGAPTLTSVEIEPRRGVIARNSRQQLKTTAHYSDGSTRDVTSMALYEPNDNRVAKVSDAGLVEVFDVTGTAAIMVRYQGQVAVFSASIPLGVPVTSVPESRNFIDDLVFGNLKVIGVPPSAVCDDATFLRRVTLDVTGRIPTEADTARFLDLNDPSKRDKLIDELLASPGYADFFANKWTALLKNRRDDTSDTVSNFAFHAWLRDSLLSNKPYDQLVRELLGATGTVISNPPVAWYKRVKEPKEQLEDVAQLFLGVRMQCAQCHHHPFERWSQDDYYALAAFFSQVGRKPSPKRGEDLIFHKRGTATARNMKTGLPVKPAALGDAMPAIPADDDPRLKLADWMSAKQNPFFAKALVNRYWKHFFGRGLIEPEDDIRDTNPPTHPELLAALEKHFIESGFDLKELVRVITRSQAYQLSATPNEFNLADQQSFSRYYPRRLQAEVLLDAIDQLSETQTEFTDLPPGTRAVALPDSSYNRSSAFLRVFGRPNGESVCECERVQSSSLAQSLFLINSPEMRQKLAHPGGRAEKLAKSDAPLEARVRELYRAAFAREPSPDELRDAVVFLAEPRVDAAGNPIDTQQAAREGFQDLIWALLNSKEFLFNH